MKEVIFVWTHKYSNLESTPLSGRHGLGDLLRGTIGILRFCEQRGYECYIDISQHPLSQLLAVTPHKYSEFIETNKDTVRLFPQHEAFEQIDNELKENDLIYFFTPLGLDELDIPITPSVKMRIRELLTPNEELSSYIDNIEMPYSNFTALHFRLGDNEVILDQQANEYKEYINFIRAFPKGNCILFSDSHTLKELAKPFIFSFDYKPTHVGFHTNMNDLKNTMFEFFLLMRANTISTYSVYFWPSGFVKLINYIYDVPLINLRS